MDVFNLRDKLIEDYSRFVRSFINIRDERILDYVETELRDGALWPEPIVQLNPAFEPGETIDELVEMGFLHPECSRIFRIKTGPEDTGKPLRLHRHQADAIKIAIKDNDFILTTGTGSGKSLAYIVPIVNYILQSGSRQGIKSVIVYPMNALANSQIGELDKFINFGYSDQRGPVTFRRYTGQESDEEKKEIIANPPDILLTNYVMLELLLTRPQEGSLIKAALGLKYLVLDELHTYRGRQGADVAMLVRRTRQALGADNLRCIGSSATLSSGGSREKQKEDVSRSASLLFGSPLSTENVICEKLRRVTTDKDIESPEFINELRNYISMSNLPPRGFKDFVSNPLAIWIESMLGVRQEDSTGELIRHQPSGVRGSTGIAQKLSALTGLDFSVCAKSIQDTLMTGFGILNPETDLPVFAFRLHQFVSRGDTVYASPEQELKRYITIQGQKYVPDDRNRILLPLVFCRECGQEYYSVWQNRPEREVIHYTPRDYKEQITDEDADAGYIYISEKNPWPEISSAELFQRLPDDWLDENGRVIQSRREYLPQAIRLQYNGEQNRSGIDAWFIRAPFRFCLQCGVSYGFRQRSDFQKLSALGNEGRSTATTILTLSAVRQLKHLPIEKRAKKLLSFTDNRQDASLQAGHFNDFIEVGILRSALYHAVQSSGKTGLTHDIVTQKLFDELNLPFNIYAQDSELRGLAKEETNRVLRDILGYRIYRDLKRGWRITAPNLEQVGLLKIEYPYLIDACNDSEIWVDCHPALANSSMESRYEVASVLLDYMRRELAIKVDYLTQIYQEGLLQRSRQRLLPPWGLDENEQVSEMIHSSVLYPRARRHNDYGGDKFLSSRSGYGQYLRRSPIAVEYGDNLTLTDTDRLLRELLDRLRLHGLVEVVVNNTEGIEYSVPGYQINAAAMVWKSGDGKTGYYDPIRRPTESTQGTKINEFFVDYYMSVAQDTIGIEAREHTAQVPYEQREEREERFREGILPILFCSPTMELGIDIAQLNVVNLRNMPPTPANYAQRSGRAGRSGQPALVFTYCSAGSPHDQYFFKRPNQMVSGSVSPPRVDLTNEDLIRTHIHAIWISEAKLSLGTSLKDIIDIQGEEPSLFLLDNVSDAIQAENAKQRAMQQAVKVLSSIDNELSQTDWFSKDWLREVLVHIPISFEQACERWKGLYLSALQQAQKQDKVIRDASRSSSDRSIAELLRRNAEAQLRLLTESKNLIQSDFYSYRYFASEGFLPGYNFPRLPLSAYIPGRRFRGGRDEFLSRPRFLAISEFGPRSIIYHEGSRYIINQVILPVRDREELQTSSAKVCPSCGYLHTHTDSQSRDLCERCGNQIQDSIRQLFRMENVVTKRRDQINCDEEERLRLGYEIKTAVRFAERGGHRSYRTARIKNNEQDLALIYYGNAATLWRINLGWARRSNREQQGFVLDIERGYWQRNEVDLDTDGDPLSPRTARVIPYVEDRKNCLLIEFSQNYSVQIMATIQAAFKNAIQSCFELENSELAAEPLPDSNNRRSILFYEASEGGAGVLRRIVDDHNTIPRIAKAALGLCHFDPDTGEDLRHAPNAKENCEAACYDCLMSYTNQTDHQLLDRQLIKELLLNMAKSEVASSPAPKSRLHHLQELINLTGSKLECDWLQFMEVRNLRLPSHAQSLIEKCQTRPDFVYREHKVAVYVDGPPHDYPERKQRDQNQTICMEDAGWTVIRFNVNEDWDQIIRRYPNVFGVYK